MRRRGGLDEERTPVFVSPIVLLLNQRLD
jgi:hypothetical protein